MTEILTAEAFLTRDELFSEPLTDKEKETYLRLIINHKEYVAAMIAFAKMHCEAQAKAIAEKATIEAEPHGDGKILYAKEFDAKDAMPYTFSINSNSILNAYPLHLIK